MIKQQNKPGRRLWHGPLPIRQFFLSGSEDSDPKALHPVVIWQDLDGYWDGGCSSVRSSKARNSFETWKSRVDHGLVLLCMPGFAMWVIIRFSVITRIRRILNSPVFHARCHLVPLRLLRACP